MTNPVPEMADLVIDDALNAGCGFMKIDGSGKAQHIPLEDIFIKPEMPDCRLCSYCEPQPGNIYEMICMAHYRNEYVECTNGSEFKPAEPIRLYIITEDK